MLKIYIYWHKCWCHRCGTTSEDRASQLLICEPLSFANCFSCTTAEVTSQSDLPRRLTLSDLRSPESRILTNQSAPTSCTLTQSVLNLQPTVSILNCRRGWRCNCIKAERNPTERSFSDLENSHKSVLTPFKLNGVQLVDTSSRLPCYVFCTYHLTNKYQKHKSALTPFN